LAPLGDYGGPTQTMALLPRSPAIRAGNPAQAGTTDQRGYIRSSSVDIGAVNGQLLTVTSAADDGSAGPLRSEIGQANSDGGGDTIEFDPTVFGTPQTITLSGSQLELRGSTAPTTITGPAAGLTIDAGGKSRVFQVDGGVTASLSGLTI